MLILSDLRRWGGVLCKGRTPGPAVRLLTFWAKATFIPENDALHFENNIYVCFGVLVKRWFVNAGAKRCVVNEASGLKLLEE
jgi:hypothetical protein